MTLKILCKLSTETKRYSSHTILQNFNLPTKQRSLLSTAILWRRPSNDLLSSTSRPADTFRRPTQLTQLSLTTWRWWHNADNTRSTRPSVVNLVYNRPPTNLRSSHCCRRRPRTSRTETSANGKRPWTTSRVNNPNTRHVTHSTLSNGLRPTQLELNRRQTALFSNFFLQFRTLSPNHVTWPTWQFTVFRRAKANRFAPVRLGPPENC